MLTSMPAHLTHTIFAEDAVQGARGSRGAFPGTLGNYLAFGAQGPDFFLHNQRTKPAAFEYGKLLHTRDYGKFVASLVKAALASEKPARAGAGRHQPGLLHTPKAAFILGFAGHAVLDREVHPFINYFSGWVDKEIPQSARNHLSHAFFERIVDVVMLKSRRNRSIAYYDFLGNVDCGDSFPAEIGLDVARALVEVFPEKEADYRSLKEPIANAYRDTRFVYTLTNPPDRGNDSEPGNIHKAYMMEKNGEVGRRFLALFHPHDIPDLDFLNQSHTPWVHPCYKHIKSSASFLDMYEEALDKAVEVVRVVADALDRKESVERVELVIGNQNLDDGTNARKLCAKRYCSPLPFADMIDGVYRCIGKEIAAFERGGRLARIASAVRGG